MTRADAVGHQTTGCIKQPSYVLQKNLQKSKENINKLNDAVELLDRNLQEQKKHQERLLAAEIQSR
jgi:hypothetical protein